MKYFGRKNSNQIYSVFELVPDYLPDDYFEDFPGCSVNNDFFPILWNIMICSKMFHILNI